MRSTSLSCFTRRAPRRSLANHTDAKRTPACTITLLGVRPGSMASAAPYAAKTSAACTAASIPSRRKKAHATTQT